MASFLLSTIAGAIGLDENLIDTIVSGIAFIALPVSVAIAVLQYHLYDLDVVVKKALVAGALVLLVIGAYAAVVGLLGVVTSGNESSGSVFVVALVLGLAFRPVTRFARRIADRLVYGRRATPYEVLTEFSERVGESYATEDVLGRMAQILGQATGAGSARVWLRIGSELRPAASWPTDAEPADVAVVANEVLPTIEGETVVEVRDRGELLGALSVAMPPNDPMNPSKERLVRDLASQAGLVLRNVRLVEELRASQRRLVTAQDQERRRLERNIHDGAQQQLVALSVKTRLARDLTARDPAKAAEMLTQIDTEIQTALDDLRDLARGIYPPLLVDKGLGAALDAQARRSPVPITIRADGLGRYAPEVEAAVYFSCLEALQNVAKYAEASSATVILAQSNGHLTFEVVDDGRGFDPASQGERDRAAGDRRPAGGAPRRSDRPLRTRRGHAGPRPDRGPGREDERSGSSPGCSGSSRSGSACRSRSVRSSTRNRTSISSTSSSGLAVYGVILGVGLLAVAARPERTIAVFQGLALAAVGALIGGVMSGDLVEGAWFAPAVLVMILVALHPERKALVRRGNAPARADRAGGARGGAARRVLAHPGPAAVRGIAPEPTRGPAPLRRDGRRFPDAAGLLGGARARRDRVADRRVARGRGDGRHRGRLARVRTTTRVLWTRCGRGWRSVGRSHSSASRSSRVAGRRRWPDDPSNGASRRASGARSSAGWSAS